MNKHQPKYFADVNWMHTTPKWVCYFDLLGFGHKVKHGGWADIASTYSQALDEFNWLEAKSHGIERAWFSDTFLFYAKDNSQQTFAYIHFFMRAFMRGLTSKGIPVRGAISCDEFCFDTEKRVYVGKGLVEAYEYGEKFNWIGFVASPSAVKRVSEVGFDLARLHFKQWQAEYKINEKIVSKELVWAYMIGTDAIISGENFCLKKLHDMKNSVADKHKTKYQNAIDFLEFTGVVLPEEPNMEGA